MLPQQLALSYITGVRNPVLSSLLDRLLVDFAEQLQVETLPTAEMSRLR